MTTVSIADKPKPPAGTVPALAAGLLAVPAALSAPVSAGEIGPFGAAAALSVYALAALIAYATVPRFHAAPHFGWPNAVTLARLVATAVVAAVAAEVTGGLAPSPGLMTGIAALAAAAIAADGLDGWLARRRGPATAFGARFDMEVDALMILVLSVLAAGAGKAGAWVVLIGAMRYAFVAAGLAWPWLEAPLPPSVRRKAVCVLQGGALVALALPAVHGAAATALAATALATLAWSFAVDVGWLARNRRPSP